MHSITKLLPRRILSTSFSSPSKLPTLTFHHPLASFTQPARHCFSTEPQQEVYTDLNHMPWPFPGGAPFYELHPDTRLDPPDEDPEEMFIFEERVNIVDKVYNDKYDKHKRFMELPGKSLASPLISSLKPHIDDRAWVAPSATISGHVELWMWTNVWYGCVIRSDVNLIRIGNLTNIQDNTIITEAPKPINLEHDGSTVIGHCVTVGHSCKLSACTIENYCVVGMGSILKPDSYMEQNSMLAAGSVLESGSRVPSGELWGGNPAKFMRHLTDEEIEGVVDSCRKYYGVATNHAEQWLPIGTLYKEAEKEDLSIGWWVDTSGIKHQSNPLFKRDEDGRILSREVGGWFSKLFGSKKKVAPKKQVNTPQTPPEQINPQTQ